MESAVHSVPAHRGGGDRARPITARPDVEIVVPVRNEAATLQDRITTLCDYLDASFPFRTVVTIADNGSTDGTGLLAQRLAAGLPGVRAMILACPGRGHALRTAWSASEAEVVAYMDVDLSTSLSALLPLVGSVLSGHSDVAVGTRLAASSRVIRGPKRELISRAYSHLVRLSLHSRVSDFQCGFKAIRRERALELLPLVKDDGWFFDTELLVTAEQAGLRINETAVEWTDDPDSSVRIATTAVEDLRGIWRVARSRTRKQGATNGTAPHEGGPATADQLLSFAGVGVLSTLSYLALFALGWSILGPFVANAVALAFCTVVNTALHRSLARGRPSSRARTGRSAGPAFLVVVSVLYAISVMATTAAIVAAGTVFGPSFVAYAAAATIASCGAALVRFSLLRGWAFPPPAHPGGSQALRAVPG